MSIVPDKQVPWVFGVLLAVVLTGAFAFFGYVQDRIQTGFILINTLSERVARLEEREKTNDIIRISIDNRLSNVERDRSFPR